MRYLMTSDLPMLQKYIKYVERGRILWTLKFTSLFTFSIFQEAKFNILLLNLLQNYEFDTL